MSGANEWDADLDLRPEAARALIASAFPELAPERVVAFPAGWDNHVFLVDDVWVFRFPRRRIAVQLLEWERDHLPHLATRLPLPVPVPAWRGAPTEAFPRPWFGYRVLAGETACRLDPTDEQRTRLAAPLGAFLRTLHGLDPATLPAPLPPDFIDRKGVARRAASMSPALRALEHDPGVPLAPLLEVVAACAAAPAFAGPLVPAHGDLYARHLLVDEVDPGRATGVIDWGDFHGGDPAVDLGIAWTFLPASAHGAFRAAYGVVDDATWMRARYRAVHYGYHLLRYGASTGDDALVRAARRSFQQALQG